MLHVCSGQLKGCRPHTYVIVSIGQPKKRQNSVPSDTMKMTFRLPFGGNTSVSDFVDGFIHIMAIVTIAIMVSASCYNILKEAQSYQQSPGQPRCPTRVLCNGRCGASDSVGLELQRVARPRHRPSYRRIPRSRSSREACDQPWRRSGVKTARVQAVGLGFRASTIRDEVGYEGW